MSTFFLLISSDSNALNLTRLLVTCKISKSSSKKWFSSKLPLPLRWVREWSLMRYRKNRTLTNIHLIFSFLRLYFYLFYLVIYYVFYYILYLFIISNIFAKTIVRFKGNIMVFESNMSANMIWSTTYKWKNVNLLLRKIILRSWINIINCNLFSKAQFFLIIFRR